MGQMTNLLVKDDTNTSVTFVPVADNGTLQVWRVDAADVPIEAQPRLTQSVEKLKGGRTKVTFKLEVPVQETIGGTAATGYEAAPKVAYVDAAIASFFVYDRSTNAQTSNLYRLFVHLLAGASSSAATSVDVAAGASGVVAGSVLPVIYTAVHRIPSL